MSDLVVDGGVEKDGLRGGRWGERLMTEQPLARKFAEIRAEELKMPKVSKDSAEHVDQHGPVEDRHEEIDGYTVNFVSFGVDIDGTPLLKGLPGDACSCPHWGYVLKGRLTYRFADREEVFEAGDAFYLPPGHVPLADAGSELVQFSPSEELRAVDAVMARNMQAMMQGT